MDNREIRYNNLLYAIRRAGGVVALAFEIGRNEKYLRQIVNKFQGTKDKNPRKVGDDLAKGIADWLGKEPYWMDQPHEDLWKTEPDDSALNEPITKPARESHAAATDNKIGWPFPSIRIERVLALPITDREELESDLLHFIEKIERRSTKKSTASKRSAA